MSLYDAMALPGDDDEVEDMYPSRSALEQAALNGDIAGCRAAIAKAGSNKESLMLSRDGSSILHVIASAKPFSSRVVPRHVEITRLLVDASANLHITNAENVTALQVAVTSAIHVFRITENMREQAGVPTVNDTTRLGLVRSLLDLRADVHCVDQDDASLLQKAAEIGDYNLCKLLLEYGVDSSQVDRVGLMAIDVTDAHPHVEQLLVDYERTKRRMLTNEEARALTSRSSASLRIQDTFDDAFWQDRLEWCHNLEQVHAEQSPQIRRANSWARFIAYAHALLGSGGEIPRQAARKRPLVIWILHAEDTVEGYLAETGLLGDANWVDRCPTEIIIFGNSLRAVVPSSDVAFENAPARVSTAAYEDVGAIKQVNPPDLVVVCMPEMRCTRVDSTLLTQIPKEVLEEVADLPAVVSLRFCPSESFRERLATSLDRKVILDVLRNPFSAAAGSLCVDFDDNGWFFAVRGDGALGIALELELEPHWPSTEKNGKIPALFWGIVDLKFDDRLPILDRVKVLETGDGRVSKFSYDGAHIRTAFHKRFCLIPGPPQQMHAVVSSDKKLTHDLMEQAGYGHITPKQVCFPRDYQDGLADRIIESLGIHDNQNAAIVLKLCNRFRGAGVLVTSADDLENILSEVLQPPEDIEHWFCQEMDRIAKKTMQEGDFEFDRTSFEEHKRHWWGNEGACFVAEQCCTSMPISCHGKTYDGTMRVAFTLCSMSTGEALAPSDTMHLPQDLKIYWLGGYWKFPKGDLHCGDLRSRCVSAAGSAGTGPVSSHALHEVYAALSDSMQKLLGGSQPDPQDLIKRHEKQRVLASYLITRLVLASSDLSLGQVHARLSEAEQLLEEEPESSSKSSVVSFLNRCRGIRKIKPFGQKAGIDRWELAHPYFELSASIQPTNANALFWQGLSCLTSGLCGKAIGLMRKSMLLDPDFKGPYVNLGVAYLRIGNNDKAIEISRAGLRRFPDSPQCNYHIAVASYRKALALPAANEPSVVDSSPRSEEFPIEGSDETHLLLSTAFSEMKKAREHEESQSRKDPQQHQAPWLREDDEIYLAASEMQCRTVAGLCESQSIGWCFLIYRI